MYLGYLANPAPSDTPLASLALVAVLREYPVASFGTIGVRLNSLLRADWGAQL